MLTHLNSDETAPARVVVLGPTGSVGAPVAHRLRQAGADVLPLGRAQLDLAAAGAAGALARLLRDRDVLIFVSAVAPVKERDQFLANMRMADAVCKALRDAPLSQLIYISSDAVYTDSRAPLTEASPAAPTSLHGMMHLAREMLLRDAWKGPLCIVRPTLVYGASDRHGGYGPNRFWREAAAGGPIKLFGNGEELRDHISAEDLAEIVCGIVSRRSAGVLNIATGAPATFEQIAIMIASMRGLEDGIARLPRSGPMPHGGFRVFDVAATRRAFPALRFTALADGLRKLGEFVG